MELIQSIVSQLGVTETQAKGGTGLIMGLLKSQLSGSEFDQVKSAVPDVGSLEAAAPNGSGLVGGISKIFSSFGGGDAGGLASLAGGFSKLGLDPEMLGKFLPIIISFLKAKGGDGLGAVVAKALS